MPLFILFLTLIVIALILMPRRPEVPAVDLSSLDLRPCADAIDQVMDENDKGIGLWALGFFTDDPRLDIDRLVGYIKKRWEDEVVLVQGDLPLQRVIQVGRITLTLEPVNVAQDHEIPRQIQPAKQKAPMGARGAILVSARSQEGGVETSLGLSTGVLALLKTCRDIQEVYWMSSETLFNRRQLERQLNVSYKKSWPVTTWVSTTSRTNGQGRSDGYTVGLDAMGGTEFEALDSPEAPADLERRLAAVVHYVVANYGVIFNGDTMGVDCLERIRLKKRPSETVHKGWVFQLHYERPSGQSTWRKG